MSNFILWVLSVSIGIWLMWRVEKDDLRVYQETSHAKWRRILGK